MIESSTLSIVVDTNLALHYKRLDQFDWAALHKGEVTLFVLPVVLRELDRLKVMNQSERLRERAAKVVRWLSELLDSGLEVSLRDTVKLVFIPSEPQVDFERHGLAHAIQDDHLLAGLISLREQGVQPLALLTADVALKAKAKSKGFRVLQPPEEEKLPSEPDPRDKELLELRREIQGLKARVPKLTVSFTNGEQRIEYGRHQTPEQPKSVEEVRLGHPLMSLDAGPSSSSSPNNLFRLVEAATFVPQEVRQRYNASVNDYLKAYAEYVEQYGRWCATLRRMLLIEIKVSNNGTMPATDIDVVLQFPEGARVLNVDDIPKKPCEPDAPRRPRGALDFLASVGAVAGSDYMDPLGRFRSPEIHFQRNRDGVVEAKGHTAAFNVGNLKHGFSCAASKFAVLYPSLEAMKSHGVKVEISAAEVPTTIEQALHIVLP